MQPGQQIEQSAIIKIHATEEVYEYIDKELRTSLEVLTTTIIQGRANGVGWTKKPRSQILKLESDSRQAHHDVSIDGMLSHGEIYFQSIYVTISYGEHNVSREHLQTLAFGVVALLVATIPEAVLHQPECSVGNGGKPDALWCSDVTKEEAEPIARLVEAVNTGKGSVIQAREELTSLLTARQKTRTEVLRAVG